MDLPISNGTWEKLSEANQQAAWARKGIFATAVGSAYIIGGPKSILYVGKSAGPRADRVSTGQSQADLSADQKEWMENWKANNPRSEFWKLINGVVDTKEIAWTNVSKMDEIDKKTNRPTTPRAKNFASISMISIKVLMEEIKFLQPKLIIFATSDFAKKYIEEIPAYLNFDIYDSRKIDGTHRSSPFVTDIVTYKSKTDSQFLLHTSHPQDKSQNILSAITETARNILAL